MTKSTQAGPRPLRPSWWRWVILSLGGTLLMAVGGVLLHHAWRCHAAWQEVVAIEAELDEADPGWRFDDVITARRPVPPGENSAEYVLNAARLLPQHYRGPGGPQPEPDGEAEAYSALSTAFARWPVGVRFDADLVSRLCRELALADDAVREARLLADRPTGGYEVDWRVDYLSTLLPHLQRVRELVQLLSFDAGFRANEGDIDGAMVSVRAIVNAGRSVGDEPTLVSLLVRVAAVTVAVQQAERVLALGEPSEAELTRLQQLLEREDAETLRDLIFTLRGERALIHRMIRAYGDGRLALEETLGERKKTNPSLVERVGEAAAVPIMHHSLAVFLNRMTEMIDAISSRTSDWDDIAGPIEGAPGDKTAVLAKLMMPAVGKVLEATRRKMAILRCAAAAVAAERFRQKNGRWPDRLDELTPASLNEVPTDPYDGSPLRLRRTEDGLVIYSVGKDRADNNGELDRENPARPGADLGFRLWDTNKRGLPPENEGP